MNKRFWSKTTAVGNGCIEWLGCKLPAGYGLFRIPGTRKNMLAHRWAYEERFGPVPYGLFVCHHCDNPKCVNTEHLFAGQPKDNVQDMIQKGRRVTKSCPNEANPNVRLSDAEVAQIRALKGSVTQRQIAKTFNIGTSQVSRIMRGYSRVAA